MKIGTRRRAILALVALTLACPAGAHAARPLSLGFYDAIFATTQGATWLQRAADAGSNVVRIDIGWVAPNSAKRPPGFNARNPGDPNYNFTTADASIRAATADHLRVILDFTGAPLWAEGPHMPPDATPGSWRPDPAAIEDYGIALARRYSGQFPDPSDPFRMLPRVSVFQLWNEPNLSTYLTPQWSGNQAVAPTFYRQMLNAFYAGVKSVDPRALVVTAGTAPFGDPQPGGQRIMPARFWRGVLCLRQTGGGLRGTGCPGPAHFDVLAHQPYSVGAPNTAALNADDVSIPDIGKLTRLLRAAERTGGALPRVHHPIWVTEVGYNTKPPNPQGVPIAEDARWVEQALELLWSQGVSLITWNTIVDQPPVPSYGMTSQSGVFYLDGRPKPALQAFHLPLVGWRSGGSTVQIWGRVPQSGRIVVERRIAGGSWQALRTLTVTAGSTFTTHLVDSREVTVRARLGVLTSMAWTVR